jgi:hypothetical protein
MIREICTTHSFLGMCQWTDHFPSGGWVADYYYVPGQHAALFAELEGYCLKHLVHLEFCVPILVQSFDALIGRSWGSIRIPPIKRAVGFVHLHPLKLSQPSMRENLAQLVAVLPTISWHAANFPEDRMRDRIECQPNGLVFKEGGN